MQTALLGRARAGWEPGDLGSKLIFWFDAERTESLTLSGALVERWRDRKQGFVLEQVSTGFKPVFGLSSLNSRPAVVFDGTDDYMQAVPGTTLSSSIPQGAAGSEIWSLAADTAVGVTGIRMLTSTGTSAAGRRATGRASAVPNVSNMRIPTGSTSTSVNGSTSLNGIHATRAVFANGASQMFVDQLTTPDITSASALNSTDNSLIIGALTVTTSFWQGPVNTVVVTQPLSLEEAAQMMTYLKHRGGL